MSKENVEIVRQLLEAANRRDSDAVLALYDEQVVYDNSRGPAQTLMGGEAIYYGHEGLRTFFRDWYEAWDNVEVSNEELIDAGNQVISVVDYRGRGRASGVNVEFSGIAAVWEIRTDKVVRVAWFATRDEALEAAGLRD